MYFSKNFIILYLIFGVFSLNMNKNYIGENPHSQAKKEKTKDFAYGSVQCYK